MKILVVDANPDNLMAAEALLKGHELTLATSLNGASDAMISRWKREEMFDVVMTDLFLPVFVPEGNWNCANSSGDPTTGQKMPVGPMVALSAISMKCKHVAVVNECVWYDNPLSQFAGGMIPYQHNNLGDTRLVYVGDYTGYVDSERLEPIAFPEADSKHPTIPSSDGTVIVGRLGCLRVKRWDLVLNYALGVVVEFERPAR